VPVEVLAAHALILSFTTTKATVDSSSGAAQHGAVVSEPSALLIAFFGLLILSVAFYAIGLRPRKFTWQIVVGGLIPAGAFIAWTMVQRTTAFDAVAPGMNFASRQVVGVLAATILPVVATLLAVRLNNSPADSAPDVPDAGPATPAAAPPAPAPPAPAAPEPAEAPAAHVPPAPAAPRPAEAPADPVPPAPAAPRPAADDPGPPIPKHGPDDEDPDSTRIIPPRG
jgi:outer membrane biosynthesis protein TonB